MGARVLLQGGGKTGEVGRLPGGRGDGSSPAVRWHDPDLKGGMQFFGKAEEITNEGRFL